MKGHQGIVKTKNRLRSKVWWPNVDKDAENRCKVCHGCQVASDVGRPQPISRVIPPTGPWQSVAIDVLGPITNWRVNISDNRLLQPLV